MKQKKTEKKERHRVNVDRKIWEQATRRGTQGANFSQLASTLLKTYVARSAPSKTKAGDKISVDITVDGSLWNSAMRKARNQGLPLSFVLRELLRDHVLRRSPGRRSGHE